LGEIAFEICHFCTFQTFVTFTKDWVMAYHCASLIDLYLQTELFWMAGWTVRPNSLRRHSETT